jgi:hypothetical protein
MKPINLAAQLAAAETELAWRASGWCSLTSSWTATSGRSGTIGMRSG